jgi:hypothetical protein
MSVYEYVVHPGTARTHLVSQMAMMVSPVVRTLCGQAVEFYGDGAWGTGDETMSGHASTCDRCRSKVYRRPDSV